MGNELAFGKRKKNYRVLMYGPSGGGKTTILHYLKFNKTTEDPIKSFLNEETIPFKNASFTIWDASGREGINQFHSQNNENVDALIYVIDSDNFDSPEQIEILNEFLENEEWNIPLLFYANKQDLPNSRMVTEIVNRIKLNILNDRQWFFQASCAILGDGLYEGIYWLYEQLRIRKD